MLGAGLVILAILVFLAGVLAGYRASWLDAYEKGRRDAEQPKSELQKHSDQLSREWQQLGEGLFR